MKKTLPGHSEVDSGVRLGLCALCFVLILGFLTGYPSPASAVTPEFFTRIGSGGSAAGEVDAPNGIATNATTGHVYIADGGLAIDGNNRIDEFTAWGDFVRAWGWGVLNGANELQVCTDATGCLKGLTGAGVGQLDTPNGIGVDPSGDVYVFEVANARVQKFTSTGQFLLMFGGEVNKSTGESICTAAQVQGGDTCGIGVKGSGPSAFSLPISGNVRGNLLAIVPAGTIFVADENRIQAFEPSGVFKAQFSTPEAGTSGALAADPTSSDLYFSFAPVTVGASEEAIQPNVYRLDSTTGNVLDTLEEQRQPYALAVDSQSNVYVYDRSSPSRILQYGPGGALLGAFAKGDVPESFGLATNVVNNAGESDVYLAETQFGNDADYHIKVYGPPPLKWAPPTVSPEIASQFATSVGTDTAIVKAEINPRYWTDATYRVQYGLEPCASGGCTEFPSASQIDLTSKAGNTSVATRGLLLAGLQPETEYHYRFVAQSGGGGPVFGPDRTFTTFAAPSPNAEACPNQVFRAGDSSQLPDCRAYEMVSPLDKNNGDIRALNQVTGYTTAVDQGAADGSALTYTSYRGFGDVKGGPFASQYVARRGPDGWANLNLSPPRGHSFFGTRLSIESQFRAFSADLSNAWFMQDGEPILDPCAPEGFAGLYRSSLGDASYHALSCATPAFQTPYKGATQPFYPELQGFSADGSVAVFRANDALTPDASGELSGVGLPIYQLYVAYGDGELRSVNVLPNGEVADEDASAGTANEEATSRFQNVERAVSSDGSRVFWTASPTKGSEGQGPGKIYLRLNATQPQSALDGSGKCSEPQLACTISVSQAVSSKPARFHTADPEGTRAVFSINESPSGASDLYEFSVPKRKATLIAHKVRGRILGASEDASRVYFASEEVLTSGANAQGQSPSAGEANVYFYDANEEGDERYRFVVTLSAADAVVADGTPSNLARWPIYHIPRVAPSGEQLLFTSTASLTGYDNRDVRSGEANMEVFLYDATGDGGQGLLRCVSCNPSGARPVGRGIQVLAGSGVEVRAAATIPLPQTQLYTQRVISDDGRRVFFNSYDPLVLSDTNGKEDVYQWEAVGKGSCSEASPAYSPPNGGCLALISSGESPSDSEFLDASASGEDVFFTTEQGLVPQDYGLVDAYDARAGGGLPPPAGLPAACEGEACQGPYRPPNDPTPASSAFEGSGNVREDTPSRRCAKGRARRNGRCVPAKRQHKKQAHRNRRTGR